MHLPLGPRLLPHRISVRSSHSTAHPLFPPRPTQKTYKRIWYLRRGMVNHLGLVELDKKQRPGIVYNPQTYSFKLTGKAKSVRSEAGAVRDLLTQRWHTFDTPHLNNDTHHLFVYEYQSRSFSEARNRTQPLRDPRMRQINDIKAYLRKICFTWSKRTFNMIGSPVLDLGSLPPTTPGGRGSQYPSTALDPADTRVYVELLKSNLSLVWVAINAEWSHYEQTVNKLIRARWSSHPETSAASSSLPTPDNDLFSAVIACFCDMFGPAATREEGSPAETLWRHIPEKGKFSVVFAFRDQYVFFTWVGGRDGELVAHHSGNWIPTKDPVLRVWRRACKPDKRPCQSSSRFVRVRYEFDGPDAEGTLVKAMTV
ncbi:uncharacterized protein BCR38DRAFT_413510 [Pseudomassariella vexata]|uniref:Uncharacterized protein n=1 Tax=Pseudomassariella vexata TaxID=1141098 RepID=A0A1Y2DFR3_9PEZI|nr:uncharacterized protein BCR38DRAFT_413510 [Pseudomassariella vexata]ORY58098.1 hypothetical protein BCR38DRAFT_413510 [Pseudomassariella vexata]